MVCVVCVCKCIKASTMKISMGRIKPKWHCKLVIMVESLRCSSRAGIIPVISILVTYPRDLVLEAGHNVGQAVQLSGSSGFVCLRLACYRVRELLGLHLTGVDPAT